METKVLTSQAIDELIHCKPYVLISRRIYRRGLDGILCLCIGPKKYALIINNAHMSWDSLGRIACEWYTNYSTCSNGGFLVAIAT